MLRRRATRRRQSSHPGARGANNGAVRKPSSLGLEIRKHAGVHRLHRCDYSPKGRPDEPALACLSMHGRSSSYPPTSRTEGAAIPANVDLVSILAKVSSLSTAPITAPRPAHARTDVKVIDR